MAFTFGASSTPNLFGSSSTAQSAASTPSLFGSSSIPSLFGGGSAPAFGSTQPAQSSGAFSFSNTASSLFGVGSTPSFGQQGGFGFGQQNAGFLQSSQQQPAPTGVLATVDNKQLTHYSKWEEINPQGQQQLIELEKLISQTKEESRQLESCARLQDSESEEPANAEAGLKNSIQGFSSACRSREEELSALNERVHELLHETETAIRTFERSYRWREAAKANPGQVLPPSLREMLSGPVVLPSHFLRKSIHRFQETVMQYQVMVGELEKLLPLPAVGQPKAKASRQADDVLRELPSALSNTHDLLYHVAAKMDALNERMELAKQQHLEGRRRVGDLRDPFKEAHRREQHRERALRDKVTVIPPAAAQHTTAGPQGPAPQSGASTPAAAGPSLFGASTNQFGAASAGSGLVPPAAGGSLGAFGGGQDTSGRASSSRSRKVKK